MSITQHFSWKNNASVCYNGLIQLITDPTRFNNILDVVFCSDEFPPFGKESPRSGDSLDRFLKFLWVLYD